MDMNLFKQRMQMVNFAKLPPSTQRNIQQQSLQQQSAGNKGRPKVTNTVQSTNAISSQMPVMSNNVQSEKVPYMPKEPTTTAQTAVKQSNMLKGYNTTSSMSMNMPMSKMTSPLSSMMDNMKSSAGNMSKMSSIQRYGWTLGQVVATLSIK